MSTKLTTTGSKKLKTVYKQFQEKFASLDMEFFEVGRDGSVSVLDANNSLSDVRKSKGDGNISIHGRKLGVNFVEEIREDVGLNCRLFWIGAKGTDRHLLEGDVLYRSLSKLDAIHSMVPEVKPDSNWNPSGNQVVVVAGRIAEEIGQKHNFYFCQNNRAFRASKYIAFYNEGRIQQAHEILGQPFDDALAENTPELMAIANAFPEHKSNGGVLEPGLSKRGMRLGPVMKVGPIQNDKLGKRGQPVPFTYGQPRYTTLELLQGAKKTSELIHGLENRVEENFVHTRGEIPGKVDILWVIDNSGSMGSHQTMLVDESEKFMNELMRISPEKRPRFQMHRTTTDGDWDGINMGTSCNSSSLFPEMWFKWSIEECGTSGSADEEGLRCAANAIQSHSRLSRSESLLVVVVTDEDDCSDNSVTSYVDSMKTSVDGKLSITSIGGGSRYAEAARLTGGKQHPLGSSGFSALLNHVKSYVEETGRSYALKSQVEDAAAIKVMVNGSPYSGFKYHSVSNGIEVGKEVASHARISVIYPTAE